MENVEKIENILKANNVKKLDLSVLGRLCKTTGMLGFYVKDALDYCGLEVDKEKKANKPRERTNSMILVINEIDSIAYEREKLEKKLNYLDKNILKFK